MAEVLKQPASDHPPTHFPDDVLMEILLKLPARPLFLFRSVCKHWLTLIESPNFILMHTNRPIDNSRINNPMLIVHELIPYRKERIVLAMLSDDETLTYNEVASDFISPFQGCMNHDATVQLLGPCNGLFCVTNRSTRVIFNPTTRQCRQLPPAPSFNYRDNPSYFINGCYHLCESDGFGFDPVSNDYKVVRFAEIRQPEFDNHGGGDHEPIRISYHHYFKVGIFTLRTNSWKELEGVVPVDDMSLLLDFNIFCNNAFHFIGGNNVGTFSILVFDLNEEVFKKFRLPGNHFDESVSLSNLNESLALIVYKQLDNFLNEEFGIWVMEKYGIDESWTNLYNISIGMEIRRPLSFGKDGEFLLESGGGRLVSFNLNTRAAKEYQVRGDPWSIYAFRYTESLVSLKKC